MDKQFTIIHQDFYLANDGKVYEVCWQRKKEDGLYICWLYIEKL